MDDKSYVIVGAEVGMARKGLMSDGQIVPVNTAGSTPLDVEFIGELMVELSEKGAGNVTPSQLADYERQVKAALTVFDFSNDSGGSPISEPDQDVLLENTKVSIEFESRVPDPSDTTDINHRILIVPSDHTLRIAEDLINQGGTDPGFQPPLSYKIDEALRISQLAPEIRGIVTRFGSDQNRPQGWTPELEAALLDAVDKWIAGKTIFADGAGSSDPTHVGTAILHSEMKAFHRSVGIYATNMCRR